MTVSANAQTLAHCDNATAHSAYSVPLAVHAGSNALTRALHLCLRRRILLRPLQTFAALYRNFIESE
jgi:hypothetical protein